MSLAHDIHNHPVSSQAIPAETVAIPANLSRLTIGDLEALYEAYQAAVAGFIGVLNQPRVLQGTVLCNVLTERQDEYHNVCDAIAREMMSRRPAHRSERYQRALFLIGHECRCGEGLKEIAALAADLAATEH